MTISPGQLLKAKVRQDVDLQALSPEYRALSRWYMALARKQTGQRGITVVAAPGAAMGHGVLWLPKKNRIMIDSEQLPVSPENLDLRDPVHFKAVTQMHGNFIHACAQAKYTKTAIEKENDDDVRELMHALEDVRVDKRLLDDQPKNEKWLHAAAPQRLKAPAGTVRPRDGASYAVRVLGQAANGMLDAAQKQEIMDTFEGAYSAEQVAEFDRIVTAARALKDKDSDGLKKLAGEAVKLFRPSYGAPGDKPQNDAQDKQDALKSRVEDDLKRALENQQTENQDVNNADKEAAYKELEEQLQDALNEMNDQVMNGENVQSPRDKDTNDLASGMDRAWDQLNADNKNQMQQIENMQKLKDAASEAMKELEKANQEAKKQEEKKEQDANSDQNGDANSKEGEESKADDGQKSEGGESGQTGGEQIQTDDGNPSDGEGEGSGEGSGEMSQEAQEAMQQVAAAVAAAGAQAGQELSDQAQAETDAAAQISEKLQKAAESYQRGDKKFAALGMAPPDGKSESNTAFGGAGQALGRTIQADERMPTSEEKSTRTKLVKRLKDAHWRERTKTRRTQQLPPGRVRTRGLVQKMADQEKGAITSMAKPWKQSKREQPKMPKVRVGLVIDTSVSMQPIKKDMSGMLWILSQSLKEVEADVAAVGFGDSMKTLIDPKKKVNRYVKELKMQGASRRVVDSVDKCVELLKFKHNKDDIRMIVMLSDGGLCDFGGKQWCEYCWPEGKALKKRFKELQDEGVMIMQISVQVKPYNNGADETLYVPDMKDAAKVIGDSCIKLMKKWQE